MQTEISLKGQYKNTVFSFVSRGSCEGRGVEGGTARVLFAGGEAGLPLPWDQHFHSVSGPRFSLKQQIAFTPHPPVCVFVHLGGKQTNRQQDRFPPCRAEGQEHNKHRARFSSRSRLMPERNRGWGLLWMGGLGIFNQAGLKTNNADCGLSPLPAL